MRRLSTDKNPFSFKTIFKESGQLLKSTIIPTLFYIFILSFLGSIFIFFFVSNQLWENQQIQPALLALQNFIKNNPTTELTAEQKELQMQGMYLYLYITIFKNAFLFIVPIGLLLFTTGKIYTLHTHEKDSPQTWLESLKYPFRFVKRGFTALFLIIFFIFLLPISTLFFLFPALILMVYGFFSFHSLILDEKVGADVLRGGIFYAKDNFLKITFLLFISVFIPMIPSFLLTSLFTGAVKPYYDVWLDPVNGNDGMLLFYFFLEAIMTNLVYFWFPCVLTVAFNRIRNQKISYLSNLQERKEKKYDPLTVKVMEISLNQKYYHCSNCGQKLELQIKKCYNCGQLYQLKILK